MLIDTFPDWLRHQLNRRGWSQAEFARQLGVKPGVVSHWFKGRRPSPASCDKIADVLGMQPSDVLRAAGHLFELPVEEWDARQREMAALAARIDWSDDTLYLVTQRQLQAIYDHQHATRREPVDARSGS